MSGAWALTLGIFDDYDVVPDITQGIVVVSGGQDEYAAALVDVAQDMRSSYRREQIAMKARVRWPSSAEFWFCSPIVCMEGVPESHARVQPDGRCDECGEQVYEAD